MPNRFKRGAKKARKRADSRTGVEEAKLIAPTWDEVRRMLPDPEDQEELDRLIAIVSEDTEHNEKVASLIGNIRNVANVVVKTLGALA